MTLIGFNHLTHEERMARWRASQQWHAWFAWRPVLLHHVGVVWLEPLERRLITGYQGSWYEYRRASTGPRSE